MAAHLLLCRKRASASLLQEPAAHVDSRRTLLNVKVEESSVQQNAQADTGKERAGGYSKFREVGGSWTTVGERTSSTTIQCPQR